MISRTLAALAWLALCGGASAAECRLDHASYTEPKSGAMLRFRPRDTATDAALTTGLFDLRLPNIEQNFAGDVTWNAGSNARPDGEIARPCTDEQSADDPGACWLWSGNVYSVGNATVDLLGDADMAAPKAILLVDFGRAVLTTEAFVTANPEALALDLFTFSSCAS